MYNTIEQTLVQDGGSETIHPSSEGTVKSKRYEITLPRYNTTNTLDVQLYVSRTRAATGAEDTQRVGTKPARIDWPIGRSGSMSSENRLSSLADVSAGVRMPE